MMRLRQIVRAIMPVALVAVSALAVGLCAAAPARAKHAAASRAPARAAASSKVAHKATVRRARYSRAVRRSRYRRRFHPSSDRISQIQQALARTGFYTGDPTGKWDTQTIQAMKSFQQAHNLPPTGKIDAVTLQDLGLGSDIAGLAPPRPVIGAQSSGSSE